MKINNLSLEELSCSEERTVNGGIMTLSVWQLIRDAVNTINGGIPTIWARSY